MKQLTLFESFARKSRLPLEITEVLWSFLPSTQELFCEQRFRYLQTNRLQEIAWDPDDDAVHSFVTFMEVDGYSLTIQLDLIKSLRCNKRFFTKYIGVTWFPEKTHTHFAELFWVDLTQEIEDDITPETIAEALQKQYIPTLLAAAKLNGNLRRSTQDFKTPPLYDLTKLEEGVFILAPDYKKWGTEREDGKKVFWPRITLENLHLLL